MTAWESFFSAFGGTATALVALGALFTFIIQHRLNLRLASFNGELQRDLAKVSAELGAICKKQEIVFGSLHLNRATIISKLYGQFVEMRLALEPLPNKVAVGVPLKVSIGHLETLWNEARICYWKNKLYFNDPSCRKIVTLLGSIHGMLDYDIPIDQNDAEEKRQAIRASIDKVQECIEIVDGVFKKLLRGEETDE